MSDRDAKLRIQTELVGTEKAAEGVAELREQVEGAGSAGAGAADALESTAAAIGKLDQGTADAADSSRQTAAALNDVAESAREMARASTESAAVAAQATDAGVAAAERQEAATRAAGAAATATSAAVSDGAEEAAAKIDDLTAEFERQAKAARESGKAFGTAEAINQVQALTTAVRESGTTAEAQREALKGMAAAITAAFHEAQLDPKLIEQTDLFRDALGVVESAIRDVDAEIARAADQGTARFGEIRTSALSFGDAAAIAIKSVNSAWEQYNDTARITPGTLTEIAQTTQAVAIALREQAAAGQSITAEQIQLQQRLQTEVATLTEKAQELTKASQDNKVALKDTDEQVKGVTSSLLGLASALGLNVGKIGGFVGNAGKIGEAYDKLQKNAKALDLNNIAATKSLGAIGGQLALVVATFLGAVKAGKELAAVNRENAESTDMAYDSVKKLVGTPLKGLADGWDGVQRALQSLLVSMDAYVSYRDADLGFGDAERRSRDFGHALAELVAALRSGRSGVDLYTTAVRDGLDPVKAMGLAVEDNAKVMKFYEDSAKGGAEGHELWMRALRESDGDTAKFLAFIEEHNARMQAAVNAHAEYASAQKSSAEAAKELHKDLDTLDRLLPLVGKGEIGALGELADQIDESTKKVRGLNEAERERIAILTELLRRGSDMTEGEKRLAAGLLAQVRAGKEASAVLNTLTRLQISYDSAIRGSSQELRTSFDVLQALGRQWDLNSQKMRQAIADTQAVLDRTDNLTAAQRRSYQATIDGLRAVDAARAQSAALETARIATLEAAEDELKNRSLETSKAITDRLTDLAQLIPLSSEYGGVVADLGSQLQQVIDNSVTLSGVDRERLQVIADLTAKGHELTAAQQAVALKLIEQARAGEQASSALNAVARIYADLDRAVDGSTKTIDTSIEVLRALMTSWDGNSIAIARALTELDAAVEKTDGLTKAQRRLFEQINETASGISSLEQTKRDLEKRNRELIDLAGELTAEQYKEYEANQRQIYSVQGQIEQTQSLLKVQTEQITSQKNVVVSTNQMVKVIEDGREVWTNIGTAQKDAATATSEAATATAEAADEFQNTITQKLADGTTVIHEVGEAATETATKLESIATAANESAPTVSAAFQKWVDDGKLAQVKEDLTAIEEKIRLVREGCRDAPKDIEPLIEMLKTLGDTASKAAGGTAGSR